MLDRALAKLAHESELAEERAPRMIRLNLNKMPAAWEVGHVSVAALWDLFARYPYLIRLADRRVLEAGVTRTLDEPLGCEPATFALASAIDESTGRYVDLRLPGDSAPLTVTGTTLHGAGGAAGVAAVPAAKTRFFGVQRLDPQRYGKDFAVVVDEVLQRLSDAGAQLEVRLEISATRADGFGDDVVRTVSENAATLRFEQSGFESE